ncbi:NAD(+)--rifampin ADP-ribosyltransferase [Mycobacteroides salmoniphilum]|uniref:hypothetical protein n=1 Tax=Mycobacteroides salmoniphilum TaxID=404941 RepID=UPI003563B21C
MTSNTPVYFHGGVVGRRPGDLIHPALDLGRDYTPDYLAMRGVAGAPKYDPACVYMTTHLGSARGYAARYKNLGEVHRPGDVYVVEPQSELLSDPEYDNPNDPGNFLMTAAPVLVTEVVERRVVLSPREQRREAWPLECFDTWEPKYDPDGTPRISKEMRSYGVTEQYMALLPKWMDFREFSRTGRLWRPGEPEVLASADEVLDLLDHLQLDTGEHVIVGSFNQSMTGNLSCGACAEVFGHPRTKLKKADVLAASIHQAGTELAVIAEANDGIGPFLHALTRRNPDRWNWMARPGRT